MSRLAVLTVVSLCLLALPSARAQDGDQANKLKELESAVAATQERADKLAARQAALARESEALSQELAAVVEKTKFWEEELIQVEITLATLIEETALRREELIVARQRLSVLTAALLRLSLLPPEVLIARPGAPGEMVRAGLVMRRLVPRMQAQAAKLRHEVADLKGLELQIEQENAEALEARRELREEEERLALLLERRRDLLKVTESERSEAESEAIALASSAKDLKGLIDSAARRVGLGPPKIPPVPPKDRRVALTANGRIDQALLQELASSRPQEAASTQQQQQNDTLRPDERQSAQAAPEEASLRDLPPLPDEPGGLVWPVSGKVTKPFSAGRGERQGLRVSGRTGSPVAAPYDGVVVYAGPFRSYGLVLILEHSGGYHSVLAELGMIDALLGQRVVAGEPVGALKGSEENPEMYVELRRNGGPIDPEPWFERAKP
ncbi:MAG: peptidoglycan DD-metalloendopeptidase family protein [Kiloniellales bacterium]